MDALFVGVISERASATAGRRLGDRGIMGSASSRLVTPLDAGDPYAKALIAWRDRPLAAWQQKFEAWSGGDVLQHPPQPPTPAKWPTKDGALKAQRQAAFEDATAMLDVEHARWSTVNARRKGQALKARKSKTRAIATQAASMLLNHSASGSSETYLYVDMWLAINCGKALTKLGGTGADAADDQVAAQIWRQT